MKNQREKRVKNHVGTRLIPHIRTTFKQNSVFKPLRNEFVAIEWLKIDKRVIVFSSSYKLI